jgi:hypothetical protein
MSTLGNVKKGFITPMDAILKLTVPELYSALEQWFDRPMLYPASELINATLAIAECIS